jgi:hypothetical protein
LSDAPQHGIIAHTMAGTAIHTTALEENPTDAKPVCAAAFHLTPCRFLLNGEEQG